MKEFLEQISSKAQSFRAQFGAMTLRIDKKDVIKDGKILIDIPKFDGDPLEYLDELYDDYAHSIPSESSDRGVTYFKPLPYNQLSDEDLVFGEPREKARLKLEMFLLIMFIERGWKELFGDKFFYQSPTFKDLVVYDGWFGIM